MAQTENPARPGFLSQASLREVAIVVFSIVIAFALDAWWDEMSRRSTLREQLPSVIAEMRASQAALDLAVGAHQRQADIVGRLTTTLRTAPVQESVTVSDTLVGPLFPQFTMDLSTSSLESFIEAGGLDLVDEVEARGALLSWSTEVEDARDDEVFLRTFPAAQLGSYLRQNFDVAAAELIGGRWLRATSSGAGTGAAALDVGHTTLRADRVLLNLLAARESHELDMTRTLVPLRDSAASLVEALERAR